MQLLRTKEFTHDSCDIPQVDDVPGKVKICGITHQLNSSLSPNTSSTSCRHFSWCSGNLAKLYNVHEIAFI